MRRASLYARLGFTVGARNRHPWGTHNRIVQFPGVFIELLAVGEMDRIPPPRPRSLSFGAFTRDFLAQGEGLSMLVLEGKGAADDAEAFRAAGIGDFDVFNFEREAKRPDGSAVKVAFSLAFAGDPLAPDTGFFTCQQHYPENFWNPAFQKHPNRRAGDRGRGVRRRKSGRPHVFLKAFAGVSDLQSNSSGITLETPRGEIQVMDSAAFRLHFAVEPPDLTRGMRLAAMRLCACATGLSRRHAREGWHCCPLNTWATPIVPPNTAYGATLMLRGTAKGLRHCGIRLRPGMVRVANEGNRHLERPYLRRAGGQRRNGQIRQ